MTGLETTFGVRILSGGATSHFVDAERATENVSHQSWDPIEPQCPTNSTVSHIPSQSGPGGSARRHALLGDGGAAEMSSVGAT